jgi:L-ascorbate metabolism protein UlaG (beta-lactamase superfamily)
MKLIKLGHSCIYVSDDSHSVLFDPGGWSDKEAISLLGSVTHVVYTHEHGDHFDLEILKQLISRHPELKVVTHGDIESAIIGAGLEVEVSESNDFITSFLSPHAKLPIPGAPAPRESGYHLGDFFTHPGDSHDFDQTKRVLALPVIAPWGKTGDAIDLALRLKPEFVIPIHDWHYHEDAREWLQGLLEAALLPSGITLLSGKSNIEHNI